jgi:hypothetical protein
MRKAHKIVVFNTAQPYTYSILDAVVHIPMLIKDRNVLMIGRHNHTYDSINPKTRQAYDKDNTTLTPLIPFYSAITLLLINGP